MADAPQCNCPKYETQDSDGKPIIIYRHGDACPNSGKTPQPRMDQKWVEISRRLVMMHIPTKELAATSVV
ncbi:hypothetical protein CKAH01_09040 [Colletotrichum kahawae]|uniref:Uncharacterized protein n=1 Tax=Colletotrichum kahawae TaxID=34407 RepID=A0AAD9Y214_COLKA|nr:hypothetical protein CKAH01_09040 [Colletotrichum kahawae]